MRWLPIVVLAVSLSCGAFDGAAQAQTAAATFHQQFNDERYGDIYDQASAAFKQSTTRDNLAQLLQAVHRKLGTFSKGDVTFTNVFSSTGSGTTVSLTYTSEYAEGRATEDFKFAIGNGRAFLVAYNINSPTLILR